MFHSLCMLICVIRCVIGLCGYPEIYSQYSNEEPQMNHFILIFCLYVYNRLKTFLSHRARYPFMFKRISLG